jgi:hypothetical protein
MRTTRPPVDYLVTTSKTSLESFQCARLNLAASLRKEMRQILDEWISVEVDARLAAWVLDRRRAKEEGQDRSESLPAAPVHLSQLAMSFLPPSPAGLQGEEPDAGSEVCKVSRSEDSPNSSASYSSTGPHHVASAPKVGSQHALENSAAGSAKLSPHAQRGDAKASEGQCALRILERLDKRPSRDIACGGELASAPPVTSQTGRLVQEAIPRLGPRAESRAGNTRGMRIAPPLRVHYARQLARQRRLVAAS